VISLLTIVLVIVGLQVWQILKEFKRSLEKINKVLDDTGRISKAVADPIEEASEFLVGLKRGISFFNTISGFLKNFKHKGRNHFSAKEEVQKEEKESTAAEQKKKPAKKVKRTAKKFFTKNGKTLAKKAS